ncbi:MAG: two-component system, OmpR family, response regulator MtrA [Blastocatellia bacterium]|jgi:DNA-binding response OmpR family regulator|nr:two-component system, OmpR family, response regulator MtrA [Blastocatellia bacterium]
MLSPRILIADNDSRFAESCAEFLENSGYSVKTAFNLADAGAALETSNIHLAILDLRLVNDGDKNDLSGLTLARRSDPLIPKIILTSFQRWEDVRGAIGPVEVERPPAVSFVAKQEGLDVLLSYVKRTLEVFAGRNWSLEIEWRARDRMSLLALIDPGVASPQLATQAEELEDVFRILFRSQTEIRVERVLWQTGNRVALSCFAFVKGKQPETFVVVCGPKPELQEEARRYKEFAPKAVGSVTTILNEAAATRHYAANLYTLVGGHLEELRPLRELFEAGPEKSFHTTLRKLFTHTIAEWSQDRFVVGRKSSWRNSFNERLGLPPRHSLRAMTVPQLRNLVNELQGGDFGVVRSGSKLTFEFVGDSYTYADPSSPLTEVSAWDTGAPLVHVPGDLSGESVLVNGNESAWVTDFVNAGLAPQLWSLAETEALVRFDWVPASPPESMHEMERELVFGDFLKPQPSEVRPSLRKAIRAIHTIRRLARQACGKDRRPYHLAILLQVGRRLAATRLGANLLRSELSRPTQLLIAAAVLCERLTARIEKEVSAGAAPVNFRIQVDKVKGEVWIGGRRINMRGHSYDLLCNFYDYSNQVRTRRQLIEDVFGEKYDERDPSQVSRLNTAIHRLRKQLEWDPENPQHLLTAERGGYRLVTRNAGPADRHEPE